MVDIFFNKVSIEDYLSLVNNMNDWDNIKEVYEKDTSFNEAAHDLRILYILRNRIH